MINKEERWLLGTILGVCLYWVTLGIAFAYLQPWYHRHQHLVPQDSCHEVKP